MGYTTKTQMVKHANNQIQYYITFPATIARNIGLKKGEIFEWVVKENSTIVLKRPQKNKVIE